VQRKDKRDSGASALAHPSAGVALASLSAVAFGTVAPLAKVGNENGADVFPLLAIRFALAAVLFIAFHRATGRSLFVGRSHVLRLMALGGLGYAVEASLFFAALERAPAGVVTLIFYSYPLITTVLSFALGLERIHGRTVGALLLGSAGVAAIFSIEGVALAGLLLAVAAAAAVAFYYVAAGVIMKGVGAGVGATWTAVGAAVATAAATVVTGQDLPADALPAAGALGAVTVVAFAGLYAAVVRIGPARTSVAQMLEPVVTILIAALFLDETITARIALGTLLIVSALPVLASTTHKEEVPPAADSL
jgi:drug/metabolite transporter (DMT)-like permease